MLTGLPSCNVLKPTATNFCNVVARTHTSHARQAIQRMHEVLRNDFRALQRRHSLGGEKAETFGDRSTTGAFWCHTLRHTHASHASLSSRLLHDIVCMSYGPRAIKWCNLSRGSVWPPTSARGQRQPYLRGRRHAAQPAPLLVSARGLA